MKRSTLWAVRLLMVAIVAAVAVMVRHSLKARSAAQPSPTPQAAASAAPTPPPGGTGMWLSGFNYERFDDNGRATKIRAALYRDGEKDEILLRQVEVDFAYVAQGKPGTTHINSDEAVMIPKINKGDFKGHVVLTTEEPVPTRDGETQKGFEVRTEQLIYRGDKGVARSEAPVTFRRKDVSGSSRGLVYNAEKGTIEFPADAYIRIDDEKVGATEIRSQKAFVNRANGVMKFEDSVRLVHGAETLNCKNLLVGYAEDTLAINRLQAVDNVVMRISGNTVLPGTSTPLMGKGSRTITADRLFALFRPDRTLQEVTALDNAKLVLTPPPGDAADAMELGGGTLGFTFDAKGQLTELQSTKGASFASRSTANPPTGTPLRIDSQRLTVRVDPPTGQMKMMLFERDVKLARGTQAATSGRARYELAEGTLELLDTPKLTDSGEGSELAGNALVLETRTQNLKARNNVRQSTSPKKDAGGPFGSATARTVITASTFEYDGAKKLANYRGGVLLRSGSDEIRAREVSIEDQGENARLLKAAGQVAATMGTKGGGPGGKDSDDSSVASRSETLDYDEAKRSLAYSGDVTLLMGELRTRSPNAHVDLDEAGTSVRELRAWEPVDATHEKRLVKGQKLVYTPAQKSVTVTGKLVSFKDLEREMQGKVLTFFMGDDNRIIVDGRELGRTETVIRPKESPKPAVSPSASPSRPVSPSPKGPASPSPKPSPSPTPAAH